MKNDIISILLIVFFVLGFSVNIFMRIIILYTEWQNGEDIHWWWEFFYTFAIPAACIFAVIESMAVLGFFSSEPAVFDFQQQTK